MIDFWVANCVSARLISLSLHLSSSFSSVAGPGCQSEAAVGSPQATDVPAWQLGSEAARALLGQGRLRADRQYPSRQASRRGGRSLGRADSWTADLVCPRHRANRGPRRVPVEMAIGAALRVGAAPRRPNHPPEVGRLFAATRSHTYRQKMQRSFAAESLAPFGAVDEMLADDYSMENQQEAAEHFMVSELTAPRSSTTAG